MNAEEDDAEDMKDLCKKCRSSPITHAANGCKHPLYCQRCAMRVATGGKCKTCGEMFSELQRV
ncbi:hypothetical protein SAICODRAFT_36512 [Saitoella complicata NRRL Y-17804]|uniref:uncharacterized protein n=1 Tax=Saitoella complicata (strain BCRC 22490 / CBS 7301 / JCM 7358 / NBRC 10748 / NRRL Y-17804) TaxID=698492 RepID=UPI0008673F61|nr:uncharacterized protein SAICODRAFT_36512 [Saitoella complicata NRRL Y-17804]ODQ51143.1 hypothetical protein SAICODRAFT_36512 [Saitoella complicata NRRL Y-17804]